MIFLGMSSSRFRAGLFGNGSVGGSPLFKYMADSKKRCRHAMAFGAFFRDGTGSGLSSRSVFNESCFSICLVLNAWSGVFVMIFLGMSSSRFRAGLFGNGSVGGSPLFKYMADSKKRRRHAMAFGAFFGDGTGSGLSSRSVSNESLPSGPDSLGNLPYIT